MNREKGWEEFCARLFCGRIMMKVSKLPYYLICLYFASPPDAVSQKNWFQLVVLGSSNKALINGHSKSALVWRGVGVSGKGELSLN